MDYNNIIEMDIWSNFGCFTKPFSNTGGLLTYLIPPKTVVIGMIGAILGYKFDDFSEVEGKRVYKLEELYDIKISVQSLFDLKVKRVVFNSHYGNDKKDMLNVKQDLLLNPKYKLYLSFPEHLKSQEKVFLNNIKSHSTVYNLYMGRNEFPVNYDFKNYLKDTNSIFLNQKNINDFFKEKPRIYGILNRNIVENPQLSTNIEIEVFKRFKNQIKRLASHFEYSIKEYPVRRYDFTSFEYIPLSFYSMDGSTDCYFSKFGLKDDKNVYLNQIGDNKWISLI
ncbi:MAG: CRISPR-associated protein Cas5 [Methanobacteriales archaeon HGW-Methanobacteriales-1]|nr:MAG: CRISPR-associated protein Cas5 [Methanobacteriales archaeon HGW-Methanobacteriales-1]